MEKCSSGAFLCCRIERNSGFVYINPLIPFREIGMHRVLVVDDDKVLQDSVKEALLYHSFAVDVANNGKECPSRSLQRKI